MWSLYFQELCWWMYCLGREYTWLLIYLLPLFLSFNDWKYLPHLVLLLFNCGIIFFERYCLWSTVAKPVKYECSNQKVTSVLILKNLEKNQGLNYPYTLVLLGKRSLKFLNTWPLLTHVLFTPQPSELEGYCRHGPGGRAAGRAAAKLAEPISL